MESYKFFNNLINEDTIEAIMHESFRRLGNIRRACDSEGVYFDEMFGSKNQSELLSKIIEKVAAEKFTEFCGYDVVNPTTDLEPDLYFNGPQLPLEVKVTCGETWTGGTFSKRPADYLLVSWDKESKHHAFVALAHLEKDDWKPGGKNYYGTSYPKRLLYEATQDGRAQVLVGSLNVNNTYRGHKLTRTKFKPGLGDENY